MWLFYGLQAITTSMTEQWSLDPVSPEESTKAEIERLLDLCTEQYCACFQPVR